MIASGYPLIWATKNEVIDFEDSNVTCKDLDDLPYELEMSHAVGANLASQPIVCGGLYGYSYGYSHSSNYCFKHTEGGWQHFVNMIDRRSGAAGIVYNKAFHIFGGSDANENTTLQSSEIVNEDGTSTEGPQLPVPIHGHAIVSINSTVSIITGGYDGTYSDKTWYFNHASQEFQPGPNLLEGRNSHSSGTITDQKTKEKSVIVVGGYNGNSHLGLSYSDSTEILMNGEWVKGKTSYKIIDLLGFVSTFS